MSLPPALTEREFEILNLLAQGNSDRAIAARIHLAPATVRWYNKQLYSKLGVSSREDAVRRAISLGVLSAPAPASTHVVERSAIRYLTNEGVSIAWQAIGSGPVDLLFMAGFVSHLECFSENADYAAFFGELGRHARVMVFDRRGVGLSDRVQGASSIEDTISDARAVLRAAGSRQAFVSGTSESGAAAVLMASIYPEVVRGLVLIGATPTPVRDGDEPSWARPRHDFMQGIDALQRTWGEPWAIERMAPSRMGDAAFAAWWARTLRAASSPASVRLILEQVMRIDVRPLLPQIPTRTLVVHRTEDRVVNVGAARHLASSMPNARLCELPGHDHVWFVEGLDIARAMVGFLAEPDTNHEADTWLAIVLHARSHGPPNEDARGILDTHLARDVRVTPRGWTALFDAPNRALRCALRLRASGRGRGAGMALHVGACRTSDGTPVGAAHGVGHRMAESALPGEILVSSTLRDLLADNALSLRPRSLDGGDGVTPPGTVWLLAAPAVDDEAPQGFAPIPQ